MHLTKNFTLNEATRSATADANGILNDGYDLADLRLAALGMEQIRKLFGFGIVPSSWYRNPELNAKVGGSTTSAHLKGLAVDFNCTRFGTVQQQFDAIRNSSISFDQLIVERAGGKEWIHISFDPELRNRVMTYDGKQYRLIT